jgi:hypothetical protein
MARSRLSGLDAKSKYTKRICEIIEDYQGTQSKLNEALGLKSSSNLLTQVKSGRTKLPMYLVEPLCVATGADLTEFATLTMEESAPDLLALVRAIKGVMIGADEELLISMLNEALREHKEESGISKASTSVTTRLDRNDPVAMGELKGAIKKALVG